MSKGEGEDGVSIQCLSLGFNEDVKQSYAAGGEKEEGKEPEREEWWVSGLNLKDLGWRTYFRSRSLDHTV